MVLFMLISVFGLALFLECIPLLRRGQVKAGVLYAVLLVTGFTVLLLVTLNIALPSPAEPLRSLTRHWVVK